MNRTKTAVDVLPGLGLCLVLALIADSLGKLPLFKDQLRMSGLLLVILMGVVVASFTKLPEWLSPGLKMAQKPVLRWAVAGLGFRLTLQEIGNIGASGLAIVVVCVGVSFVAGFAFCRLIGLSRDLGFLLATGGSVCGASAIAAADSVVEADGLDVAVSMGIITLWGTIGIFVFPWLGSLLHYNDFTFGMLCGSTLHETAQVVAAASGMSKEAVAVATVVKLVRICTLAPIVFGIAWAVRRSAESETKAKVPLVPWFLVMFCVFSAVVSFGGPTVTATTKTWILPVVQILLAVGMAGVGLQTNVRDIWKSGWRAVTAGLVQWLVLIGLAIVLIQTFGLTG